MQPAFRGDEKYMNADEECTAISNTRNKKPRLMTTRNHPGHWTGVNEVKPEKI
jgi:hypothetical protein